MGGRAHIGQSLTALKTHWRGSIVCERRAQSGQQLLYRVAALTLGLRRVGLSSGDRVAIAALNSEWYLEWLLAVPCAGGIIAPLNYRWSTEEAREAVQQIGAVMLVVDDTCAAQWPGLKSQCPSLHLQVLLSSGLHTPISWIRAEEMVKWAGPSPELELSWGPDSIALICFTSGTTGRPKGVAISHSALVFQSLAKIAIVGYSSSDVYLHATPLCHIGGISSALAAVMAGCSHVILPKFQAEAVLAAMKDYQVTSLIVVPTMLADLVAASKRYDSSGKCSFPSVLKLLNGAGGIHPHLLESIEELFPAATIMSAYGMTEACSSMSFAKIHEPGCWNSMSHSNTVNLRSRDTGHLGGTCVGKPAPHIEIKIAQPLSKQDLQGNEGSYSGIYDNVTFNPALSCEDTPSTSGLVRGTLMRQGNVFTRGPHVMERYWDLPKETASVLGKDGWLDTGDTGWIDEEGYLWLLGRTKDVIKSGGENVYASEVEDALNKHPGVLAAVVVGIPDPRMNEVVGALVRLRDQWHWQDPIPERTNAAEASSQASMEERPSELDLRSHCQQLGLSRYKVPKIIIATTEPFPVTSTGKIRKNVVKQMVLARLAQSGSDQAAQTAPSHSRL